MAFGFLRRGGLRGEKVGFQNSLSASLTATGILRILLRFAQFVMGITVIGLYAQDLHRAHKVGVYYDSKWMYATVVGTFGAFFALVAMLPIKTWMLFPVDLIMFVLFIVAFGIFGKMFIHENPEGDAGIIRMKRAVWILLVNALLWFFSMCYGAVAFWRSRKARTTHTGAASVHA